MTKWQRLANTELLNLLQNPSSGNENNIPGLLEPPMVRTKRIESLFTAYWILLLVGNLLALLGIITKIFGIDTFVLIAAAVIEYVLLYRLWQVIQDGYARTTPGKAIGYMFIPGFNIYWIFQALPGLSTDMNAFITRYQIPVKLLPVGLAVTIPILTLISIAFVSIPNGGNILSYSIARILSILLFVTFFQWKNAATRIIAQQQ